jgi:hypothetical protein
MDRLAGEPGAVSKSAKICATCARLMFFDEAFAARLALLTDIRCAWLKLVHIIGFGG